MYTEQRSEEDQMKTRWIHLFRATENAWPWSFSPGESLPLGRPSVHRSDPGINMCRSTMEKLK